MDDSAIGEAFGEVGFTKLVSEFYLRVRTDDVLGPLYPDDDWEGAEKRLRDFLIYRFGVSDRYIQERGHPRLGMRHASFGIGLAERDRWLELMRAALDTVEVSDSVSEDLFSFLTQVAEFLRNR